MYRIHANFACHDTGYGVPGTTSIVFNGGHSFNGIMAALLIGSYSKFLLLVYLKIYDSYTNIFIDYFQ